RSGSRPRGSRARSRLGPGTVRERATWRAARVSGAEGRGQGADTQAHAEGHVAARIGPRSGSGRSAKGLPEIPVRLQMHPRLRRRAETLRETQGGIRSDSALSENDLVQAVEGHAQLTRCFDLREAERLQELFEQHLARMDRWTGICRITSD